MRCRNHSRATKIGQRTWNRNELCSKGVPCRSRIRNLISPTSASASSVTRRPKLTRAELTTERSSAMAPSRRTKPWSSTAMLPSGKTSGMTATQARVTGAYVGASGFSYPSWKPRFLPRRREAAGVPSPLRGAAPVGRAEHDRLPAARRGALRALGRRDAGGLPVRRQAARPLHADSSASSRSACRLLGERLGPIRVAVQQARDPGPARAPSSARSTRRSASPSTSTTIVGRRRACRRGSA